MNEHDEQDSWKALQAEFGLTPGEEPARPEQRVRPPKVTDDSERPAPRVEPREISDVWVPEERHPVASQFEEPSAFGAGITPEIDEVEETQPADNVEVGEAPEEVPEPEPEPAQEGEKRRRRRRRRRGRRGRDEGAGDEESVAAGSESPDIANGQPADEGPDSANDLAEEADGGAEDEDDDEDDVEPISFTDWNVPTWNELIASLFRPER